MTICFPQNSTESTPPPLPSRIPSTEIPPATQNLPRFFPLPVSWRRLNFTHLDQLPCLPVFAELGICSKGHQGKGWCHHWASCGVREYENAILEFCRLVLHLPLVRMWESCCVRFKTSKGCNGTITVAKLERGVCMCSTRLGRYWPGLQNYSGDKLKNKKNLKCLVVVCLEFWQVMLWALKRS